jgi:hypothetical protein
VPSARRHLCDGSRVIQTEDLGGLLSGEILERLD